jgi:hypothetical protein
MGIGVHRRIYRHRTDQIKETDPTLSDGQLT